MVKTKTNETMDYSIPRLRYHQNASKEGSEKETLTKAEREAHQILSKTNHDSVWGIAIRRTIDKNSVPEFRKLIKTLQEIGPAMIKIIGEEAYEAVSKCDNDLVS